MDILYFHFNLYDTVTSECALSFDFQIYWNSLMYRKDLKMWYFPLLVVEVMEVLQVWEILQIFSK